MHSNNCNKCQCHKSQCQCDHDECHRDPNKEYSPDTLVNPDKNHCTLCTGDKSNNIFFLPRAPGYPGRCVLDELTYAQVYEVMQRVPGAKEDLMRITHDPTLLQLARECRLVESPQDENQRVQKRLHENSLPMYTVLKGNQDGTPGIR